MVRRLAAVLAALALMAFTAAVAIAATVNLDGTPIAWNDPEVEVECEADISVPSGMVLWHFIAHTSTAGWTLTADFSNGGDVSGMAATKTVDRFTLHWDVITPLGDLNSASISGSGDVTAFNLSHVCPNPGEIIPEAPASALLVATAAILGLGFIVLRRREGLTPA
jgi:hypothetical protein